MEKGIGVIAMKTCSGGKYSPSADIEPSYKEAVTMGSSDINSSVQLPLQWLTLNRLMNRHPG